MAFGSANTPGAGYLNLIARLTSLEKALSGLEKLSGNGGPTSATIAQVGQIYIDIITEREWICVEVTDGGTVWEPRESGAALSGMAELTARLTSLEKTLSGLEKLTGNGDPTSATTAQVGQIYINISTGQEWVCTAVSDNGTTWEEREAKPEALFVVGAAAPERTGVLWIDTTPVTGGLKYHDGSAWVNVPTATV